MRRCSSSAMHGPHLWRSMAGELFCEGVLPEPVAPEPVPAEEWETIDAADVRVGDWLEVTREWDGGSYRCAGRVRNLDVVPGFVNLGDPAGFDMLTAVGTSIRRRVRAPMPEPAAPAVVRHAGRLLSRSVHHTPKRPSQWMVLSGPLAREAEDPEWSGRWLSWPAVLALDPATEPVLIDLGGE